MKKSFDFALSACGHDRESGQIWANYIAFVKSWDTKSTPEAFAKQRNELRKIYRRAVAIPLENLEELWKDYNAFESQDKQEVCICYLLSPRVGLIFATGKEAA